MFKFSVVLCFATPLNAFAAEPISPEDVEDLVIQNRKAIISGQITVRQISYDKNNTPVKRLERELRYWFDGDRMRLDEIAGFDTEAPYRQIHCANCERPKTFTSYTTEKTGATNITLSVGDYDREKDYTRYMLADPRMLGFMATDFLYFLYRTTYTSELKNPDRRTIKTETVKYKNKNAVLLSFAILDNKVTKKFWISPDEGYTIVRCESRERIDAASELVDEWEGDTEYFPDSRLWFPTQYRYRRSLGGIVQNRSEGTVEVKSLNAPINEDVFKASSMGLEKGTVAIGLVPEKKNLPYIWEGDHFEESHSTRPGTEVILPPKSKWRPLLFKIGIAFGALTAIVLISLMIRRIRRASPVA